VSPLPLRHVNVAVLLLVLLEPLAQAVELLRVEEGLVPAPRAPRRRPVPGLGLEVEVDLLQQRDLVLRQLALLVGLLLRPDPVVQRGIRVVVHGDVVVTVLVPEGDESLVLLHPRPLLLLGPAEVHAQRLEALVLLALQHALPLGLALALRPRRQVGTGLVTDGHVQAFVLLLVFLELREPPLPVRHVLPSPPGPDALDLELEPHLLEAPGLLRGEEPVLVRHPLIVDEFAQSHVQRELLGHVGVSRLLLVRLQLGQSPAPRIRGLRPLRLSSVVEVEPHLIEELDPVLGEHPVRVRVALGLDPVAELPVVVVPLRHVAIPVLVAVRRQRLVIPAPQLLALEPERPAPPPEVQAHPPQLRHEVIGELAVPEVLPLSGDPPVELGHVRLGLVPGGDLEVPVHLLEGHERLVGLVPHDGELDLVRLGDDELEVDGEEPGDAIRVEGALLVEVAHPSDPVSQRGRVLVRELLRHVGVSVLLLEVDQLAEPQIPLLLHLVHPGDDTLPARLARPLPPLPSSPLAALVAAAAARGAPPPVQRGGAAGSCSSGTATS